SAKFPGAAQATSLNITGSRIDRAAIRAVLQLQVARARMSEDRSREALDLDITLPGSGLQGAAGGVHIHVAHVAMENYLPPQSFKRKIADRATRLNPRHLHQGRHADPHSAVATTGKEISAEQPTHGLRDHAADQGTDIALLRARHVRLNASRLPAEYHLMHRSGWLRPPPSPAPDPQLVPGPFDRDTVRSLHHHVIAINSPETHPALIEVNHEGTQPRRRYPMLNRAHRFSSPPIACSWSSASEALSCPAATFRSTSARAPTAGTSGWRNKRIISSSLL